MNTNLKELTKYTDFHNKMCEEHKRRTIYKVEVTRDNNRTALTVDPKIAKYIGLESEVLSSLENELYTLWQNLEKMHTMLFEIWHKNNKPFGFEVFDARFGGVCARAKHAYDRVRAYVDGKLENLPEFEEERLYYARSGKGDSAFSWDK